MSKLDWALDQKAFESGNPLRTSDGQFGYEIRTSDKTNYQLFLMSRNFKYQHLLQTGTLETCMQYAQAFSDSLLADLTQQTWIANFWQSWSNQL